jgi:hypothetical protein
MGPIVWDEGPERRTTIVLVLLHRKHFDLTHTGIHPRFRGIVQRFVLVMP